MTDERLKLPGPEHPISIEANPSRIVVTVGGRVIADTSAALTLREARYCPYKGAAFYYNIPAGRDRSINAVRSYAAPFEAMKQIKDHVAFYPDRVDQIS